VAAACALFQAQNIPGVAQMRGAAGSGLLSPGYGALQPGAAVYDLQVQGAEGARA
jgi:hypothetical protein